jgi:hypothetical protein
MNRETQDLENLNLPVKKLQVLGKCGGNKKKKMKESLKTTSQNKILKVLLSISNNLGVK